MQNSNSRLILHTWRESVRVRKEEGRRREQVAKVAARMARGTVRYIFLKWTRWTATAKEKRQQSQGSETQALIAKIRSDNLMARISGRFFHQYRTQSFFKWKNTWLLSKQKKKEVQHRCCMMIKRMQVSNIYIQPRLPSLY